MRSSEGVATGSGIAGFVGVGWRVVLGTETIASRSTLAFSLSSSLENSDSPELALSKTFEMLGVLRRLENVRREASEVVSRVLLLSRETANAVFCTQIPILGRTVGALRVSLHVAQSANASSDKSMVSVPKSCWHA